MHGLAVTLVKAAALFAATNVDGLVVLTTLFMNSATGRPRRWQIITGQYLGFAAMLLLSLLAALGLRVVPDGWVGLIGLLPLAVGVNGLRRACEADTRQVARTACPRSRWRSSPMVRTTSPSTRLCSRP
jgi:cadmium resistance protein CadD (predicted permease)